MDKHRDNRGDRYGDYPDSHRNSHSATSSWSSSSDPVPHHDRNFDTHGGRFPGNGDHQHHHGRPHQHSNHRPQPNFSDSIGGGGEVGSGNSLPLTPRKRQFLHSGQGTSPDYIDGGGSCVKLYIGGVPRAVTEQDIRSLFEEHGNIVEVVLIKDKRTGQQQECCFVKYAMLEEASRAIGALHNQYTFPGGVLPIKVKYADGHRERLGGSEAHVSKLYVGCLNKQALRWEIEEVFSPYGLVEDIFIVRDELRQSRGCAFVQLSQRDMAVAAINALNGTYVMRGCDQPLIVRFAEPKKPRAGESRPASYISDPRGRNMLPNALHPVSPKPSSRAGSEPQTVASTFTVPGPVLPSTISSAPAVPTSTRTEDPLDCDWSEHICPDGYEYYYNCVTCESRWEKPEEYTFYEQQLQNWQQRQHPLCQQLHSQSHPAGSFYPPSFSSAAGAASATAVPSATPTTFLICTGT